MRKEPKSRYPKTKSEQDIDPIVYLQLIDLSSEPYDSFRVQIYKHRHKLYQLYRDIIPRPDRQVSDEEEANVFHEFLSTMVQDYCIHYGLGMYLLHSYLIILFWSRVLYCPPIDDGQTYWLLSWLPLTNHISISCTTRPIAFVDFIGWNLALFYTATFFAYHISPLLESHLLVFWSFWINGLVNAGFWFISENEGWILSGSGPLHASSTSPQDSLPRHLRDSSHHALFGRWNAVFIPLVFWWAYLVMRRNRCGLSHWEHHMSIKAPLAKDDDHDDTSSEEESTENKSPSSRTRFFAFATLFFRIWQMLAPFLAIYFWKWYNSSQGDILSLSDISSFPSTWFICLISISSSAGLLIWYSYLNFQHQCIYWFVPHREGIVINSFENEVRLGLIY